MMAGDQANGSAEIHLLSQEIATLLTNTLTPDRTVRKTAEEALLRLENSSKLFGLATLYLTRIENLAQEVHIAAAIAFKNFIKCHWRYDPNDETSDQVDIIDPHQRELIKQHITGFMIESPPYIQRQLSEAITIIGQSDFPEKWPTLIVELETFLRDKPDKDLPGILQTAHSIFRRYRYEFQSDRLWSEIKLVMKHFAPPFTHRFRQLVYSSERVGRDTQQIALIYQCLHLCTKIYHSLITQDLPEYFEDHLNEWIPAFVELLKIQDELPDNSLVIGEMQSEICEIASLFVQRYSDAENFKEYTRQFAQQIWSLLVTTNNDVQNDTLVSSAIRYLVTAAERPESRSMFQDSNVLDLLCQRVIIPNMTIRDIDEELFEDDPEEYVKRDIEGSDIDTRRRAACDLVQSLSKFLEIQLIEIFGRFIEDMLKSNDWKHKDLAIFLYSSFAIKGSTRQHGTVSTSKHVNVEQFFEKNIVVELLNDLERPGSQILKADALRYITTFRNHISLNTLITSLPLVVKLIKSKNVVVRTYASITLERLLVMRDPLQPKVTAFKPQQFEQYMNQLVTTLFEALELPGSPENEHIMRAIMRLFSFMGPGMITQFLPEVVPLMTTKLGMVARNPSKPYFNHYLFETLALTIQAACSQENASFKNDFEIVLFNILEAVLAQDVQEFVPYMLQLLNLMLQSRPNNEVSQKFVDLFQELLKPAFWEHSANVRSLTELMHSYVEKLSQSIINSGQLNSLLGIFQKLIASKATDHEGLALLQSMMIHMPAPEIDARIRDIFFLMFQRLTGSKTTKFARNSLVCFSLYAYLRGADQLASVVNQIQPGIFDMLIEKVFIPDVGKVTINHERRICVIGIVKILTYLRLNDQNAYIRLRDPLLSAVKEISEPPVEISAGHDDDDDDTMLAQCSKLHYATVKRQGPIDLNERLTSISAELESHK